MFKRASGILLHPTSLPSKFGIGDFGPQAYRFVEFLHRAKQRLWQILPINPAGYGESPFQCYSAFAGNPVLISLERLVQEGLLTNADLEPLPNFNGKRVNYSAVNEYKEKALRKAFNNFKDKPKIEAYQTFVQSCFWLGDYAFFMALKHYFGGKAWNEWEPDITLRKPEALTNYHDLLKEEIAYHYFLQYIFFSQWLTLKSYANEHGIKIIGDLPIFISYDSSDAWANPHLFELDEKGTPTKVAGVPPDYFSETGQLWGNPHYRWAEMEKDDFKWWRQRFGSLLRVVDIIRIDHFRGFEAYWEIPAGSDTAINGRWVKAPGDELFSVINKYMGEIPVIAEDLGVITPEVELLKNKFNFPGMKILHFSLNYWDKDSFDPAEIEENSVVYTGTHDNDTTVGWYRKVVQQDLQYQKFINNYFEFKPNIDEQEVCWEMIELAFKCKSNLCIIPMQDILCLDSEARMNYPGTVDGNWQWRLVDQEITTDITNRLRSLTEKHSRI